MCRVDKPLGQTPGSAVKNSNVFLSENREWNQGLDAKTTAGPNHTELSPYNCKGQFCEKKAVTHPGHHVCTSLLVYCTSFQIGRGSDILEVVHVDDIDDWRHHPGLVLRGKDRHKITGEAGWLINRNKKE